MHRAKRAGGSSLKMPQIPGKIGIAQSKYLSNIHENPRNFYQRNILSTSLKIPWKLARALHPMQGLMKSLKSQKTLGYLCIIQREILSDPSNHHEILRKFRIANARPQCNPKVIISQKCCASSRAMSYRNPCYGISLPFFSLLSHFGG